MTHIEALNLARKIQPAFPDVCIELQEDGRWLVVFD